MVSIIVEASECISILFLYFSYLAIVTVGERTYNVVHLQCFMFNILVFNDCIIMNKWVLYRIPFDCSS